MRDGHFVGSDSFIVNYIAAGGSASINANIAKAITNYGTAYTTNTYGSTTGYGVYPYSLRLSGGIVINARYNSSSSLTIDGTYSVDVFTLDYPDGYPSPFAE